MHTLNIIILDFDDIRNTIISGGQAKATNEVGKRLVSKGHSVTVISSRFPGCKTRTEDGITYRHIGVGSRKIQLNNLFYILSLPFTVRNLNADIIIECSTAPISTLLSPLFTRTPVVILPATYKAILFTQKYRLPFHWIEKFGTKLYKYALPYSEAILKRIQGNNPSIKYKIVPQGVDDDAFTIKPAKAKHILFLSRFDIAQKGIDLLLQAYAKVRNKISYPLILAGYGYDEEKIRQMINDLHLEDRVSIVGPVYGEKKRELLSETLVTTLSNKGGGMSLWAVESLASGLPVVCFDIPETEWIPETISFKAKAFNADDFAKQLLKAVQSKKLPEMKKKARSFARQFSWDKVADAYEEFFYEILEGKEKSISKIGFETFGPGQRPARAKERNHVVTQIL